jgi:hypothetical protein
MRTPLSKVDSVEYTLEKLVKQEKLVFRGVLVLRLNMFRRKKARQSGHVQQPSGDGLPIPDDAKNLSI